MRNLRNYKHGLSSHNLYYRWNGILDRCNNKNSPQYKYYGERGIEVCEEWKKFIPFYNWAINNGYKKELEIDRINNNGNYCPENCRFVNHLIQMNNKRDTLIKNQNINKIKINEFCRIKRISLNISQKLLAIKINVRTATISDFETGKYGISSKILELIFNELNIKLK